MEEVSKNELEETEKPKRKSHVFFPVITVIFFFALLAFLLATEIKLPDSSFSQTENRSLAQKPEISISTLKNGNFMTRFESYMSDQFPKRDTVVSLKSTMQRLLGNSEQNNVYIGKDGWLFEKQTPFDEEKVQQTTDAISEFSKSCKIKNQVFMLVPDSTCLLKNKLPSLLSVESQEEQIKKVYASVPENIKKVNTVSILKNADRREDLYYKTDHHWTTRAAKRMLDGASNELQINPETAEYKFFTVSNDFYGTLASSSGIYDKPDKVEICMPVDCQGTYFVNNADTKTKAPTFFDLSKLNETNKYEVFAGGNFSRITISTTTLNKRNLLILKDSYANCFIPLLTPHYQNIVIIDARYFTDDLQAVLGDYKFTDLLILYNVNTFLEDTSLKDIL